MPGESFSNLVIGMVAWLGMAVACAWFLIRADHEAMRLFNLKKLYGLTKDDDETERKKTKKGVVFLYSLLSTIAWLQPSIWGIRFWHDFEVSAYERSISGKRLSNGSTEWKREILIP